MKPRFKVITLVTALSIVAVPVPLQDLDGAHASGASCDATITNGFGGGTGSAGDPYLICNRRQLARIATSLTSNYLVKADISLSGQEWTPIPGNFTGTLDGGYSTISGLTISTTGATSPVIGGLFETLASGAVVRKIRFSNSSLNIDNSSATDESVGVLAGKAAGNINISEIVINSATITGDARFSGLLIGDSSSSGLGRATLELIRVRDSSLTSSNNTSQARVGGLIGRTNNVTAKRIAIEATQVRATRARGFFPATGGLFGHIRSTADTTQYISEVEVNASITVENGDEPFVGGIVGQVDTTSWLEIANSRFSGSITLVNTPSFRVSGLIGWGGNPQDHTPQIVSNTLVSGNLGSISADAVSDLLPGRLYVSRFNGSATADGTKISYTTAVDHRLEEGELVTITGASPASFNASPAVAASLTANPKTFSVVNNTQDIWDKTTDIFVRGAKSEVPEVYFLKDGSTNQNVSSTNGGTARTTAQLASLATYGDASWKIASSASASVTSTWQLNDATDPIWKLIEVVAPSSATSTNFPQLVWLDYWPVTLAAPSSVSATIASSPGTANVTWTAPTGSISGYKIESSVDGGNTWVTQIADSRSNATTAEVSGLVPGSSYSFRVSAFSTSAFPSSNSLSSPALTMGSTPSAPQNLAALNLSPNSFRISWDPPSNTGGLPLSSYTLQVDKGNGFETVAHTGTSADVSGLFLNSVWSFRVLATNVVGNSSYAVYTNVPPVPYAGPIVESFSSREIRSGAATTITLVGQRLAQVTELFIGSTKLSFTRTPSDQLIVTLPALAKGVYDLRMVYTGGAVITHQAAFTAVDVVTATPSRTLILTNFAGDGFRLPAAAARGIRTAVSSLGEASKIICTGSTSGTRATASDRRLALRRAQEACNLAKRLVPGVVTEVRANPASGIGARFRSVSITISGN